MTRTPRRTMIVWVAAGLAAALTAPTVAQDLDVSQMPTDPGARVYFHSPSGGRFSVAVWAADLRSTDKPDGLSPDLLRYILRDTERSYDVFTKPEGTLVDGIEALGLKKHEGWKCNNRILMGIYDFGETETDYGWTTTDGRIRLSLRALRKFWPGKKAEIANTTAHELFHNIQYAYDSSSPSWIKEATASWAGYYAVPSSLTTLHHQARFLGHAHRRLRIDKNCGEYTKKLGHPYGTSLFMSYLVQQRGRKVIRDILAAGGPDGFKAVFQALGCKGLDEAFRNLFDRFAVALVLLDEAPAECRVDTPENVRLLSLWARAIYGENGQGDGGDFPPRWVDGVFAMNFHYRIAPASPEQMFVVLTGGRRQGVGGVETWQVAAPSQTPADSELCVSVNDPDQALGVQALVRYAQSDPWQVRPSVLLRDLNQRVLRIPRFDKTAGPVRIVVTNYSSQSPETHANVLRVGPCFAISSVPVLSELKIYQDRLIVHRTWQPNRTPDGLLTGHEAKTLAVGPLADRDARIELTFSQQVSAKTGRPLCRLNGRDVGLTGGPAKTFSGTIPRQMIVDAGTAKELLIDAEARERDWAKMPLDQDPLTPAIAIPDDWQGYERTQEGMKIALAGGSAGGFHKGDIASIDRQFAAAERGEGLDAGKGTMITSFYKAADRTVHCTIEAHPHDAAAQTALKNWADWWIKASQRNQGKPGVTVAVTDTATVKMAQVRTASPPSAHNETLLYYAEVYRGRFMIVVTSADTRNAVDLPEAGAFAPACRKLIDTRFPP